MLLTPLPFSIGGITSKRSSSDGRFVFGMVTTELAEFSTKAIESRVTRPPPSMGSRVTVNPVRHDVPVTGRNTWVHTPVDVKTCDVVDVDCVEHPLAVPVWLT